MEIIRRYKDANGNTIGYDIANGTVVKFVSVDRALDIAEFIINAVVVSGKEFRAKKGYKIDTVVLHSNELAVRKPVQTVPTQSNSLQGIDFYGKEFINVCRRLRTCASKNNFTVDMSRHKSNDGRNTHLFKLIEACDIDVRTFIRGYLYNIQPYSLSKFQGSKNIGKNNIWLSDMGYGVSLVIKVNNLDRNKPIVLSFHESNVNSSYVVGNRDFSDKLCAVLVESVVERPMGYGVDYIVQRGFISHKVHSSTLYFNNGVALVRHTDISVMLDDTMSSLWEKLRLTYYGEEVDKLPMFVDRLNSGRLSFMSLGFATANNLCLLIDMFAQYTDTNSRRVLSEITMNLLSETPLDRLKQIKVALQEKYSGSRNKLYLAIVQEG